LASGKKIWQYPLTSICKINEGSFQWWCEDKDITNGGLEAQLSTKEGERKRGIQGWNIDNNSSVQVKIIIFFKFFWWRRFTNGL
jgi:hypothetical protein